MNVCFCYRLVVPRSSSRQRSLNVWDSLGASEAYSCCSLCLSEQISFIRHLQMSHPVFCCGCQFHNSWLLKLSIVQNSLVEHIFCLHGIGLNTSLRIWFRFILHLLSKGFQSRPSRRRPLGTFPECKLDVIN